MSRSYGQGHNSVGQCKDSDPNNVGNFKRNLSRGKEGFLLFFSVGLKLESYTVTCPKEYAYPIQTVPCKDKH